MNATQNATTTEKRPRRKGDGGTYLVVADDTDEFRAALRYACASARVHRARVGILMILDNQDFQHWGAVEEKVKKELREEGEKYLWTVAKTANDFNGTIPSLYFAEGEGGVAVIKTIDEDEHIIKLVVGNRAGAGPGPLISYCLGKGLEHMRVPLVVVPAHLKEIE